MWIVNRRMMQDKDSAGPWICNAMRSLVMLASDVRIREREREREERGDVQVHSR